MVACVGAQEDKGVGRGGYACEGAEVAVGVAGRVEKVERTILEIVDGGEAADTEAGLENQFVDWAIGGVGVEDGRERVGRIGGLVVGSEAWADDERGGSGKSGWVSDMVEVVLAFG